MGDWARPFRRSWKHTIHLFGVCSPVSTWTQGDDHTGIDAFLRCPICRRRTKTHVECHEVTPAIRAILQREWRPGNITERTDG